MVFKGFDVFPRDGPAEEFLNKQAARCISVLTGSEFQAAHFKTDTVGKKKGRQAAVSQLKDPVRLQHRLASALHTQL